MNGDAGVDTPDEQETDGCDCPIEEADATPDEDLPAANGGVA